MATRIVDSSCDLKKGELSPSLLLFGARHAFWKRTVRIRRPRQGYPHGSRPEGCLSVEPDGAMENFSRDPDPAFDGCPRYGVSLRRNSAGKFGVRCAYPA